jgi:hypothetical protein
MIRSLIDSVAVLVHDAHTPGDAEWTSWVNAYRTAASKLRAVLVYSLGGGPNGKQRSELTAVFGELAQIPPAYILTSSVAARGIVTALAWFLPPNQQMKAYPPEDLDKILAQLKLSDATRAEIKRTIQAHVEALQKPASSRHAG